ncbi:MAG: TniB family NTP-binding protein [Cryobacterium sp.]|nr:TniB family NTP-binding protein [Cryobacterium sp.]
MSIKFHTPDTRPGRVDRLPSLTEYLKKPALTVPEHLTDQEYAALGKNARADYDQARLAYLSGGLFLPTPYFNSAKRMLHDCFENNFADNTGHTGVMLSGHGTVGKTTITKQLAKWVYNDYRRSFPEFEADNRVPVVFIEVPAASTGKSLMVEFAEFLGLTYKPSDTMTGLRNRVTDMLNRIGTQLVIVDELHNLSRKNVATGETVQILKELHDDLPATFLYAGINLTTEGELLSGSTGRQLAGRFSVLEMRNFALSTPQDVNVWMGVVDAFERKLCLRHQEPGSLVEEWQYLCDRTNGNISSLSKLLTGEAIRAIRNPARTTERLDQAAFVQRTLDHAAETARASRTALRNSPRRTLNLKKGLT